MQFKIQPVQFDADRQLTDFIQDKLQKLEKFDDNIIGGEVYLKEENNNGADEKIIEVRLHVPGKDLFAKKAAETFETATDEVLEALEKQVKKHKDKLRNV